MVDGMIFEEVLEGDGAQVFHDARAALEEAQMLLDEAIETNERAQMKLWAALGTLVVSLAMTLGVLAVLWL